MPIMIDINVILAPAEAQIVTLLAVGDEYRCQRCFDTLMLAMNMLIKKNKYSPLIANFL